MLDLNEILVEAAVSLGYVLAIFILQVGLFLGKQWRDEKKQRIDDNMVFGFAFFFLLFAIGSVIYFHVSSYTTGNFEFYVWLSMIIRGSGALILTFIVERQFLNKTRYLGSITLGLALGVSPLVLGTVFFSLIFNVIRILTLGLPLIFMIYFIGRTLGDVRKKLYLGLAGFILVWIGLIFSSYGILDYVETLPYSGFILFPSKMIAILGTILIIYGFNGYSFFQEIEWKSNLIALFIIDKTRMRGLYQKVFQAGEIEKGEILVGGIAGITKVIGEFTQSSRDVDFINVGNSVIVIGTGEKIVTAIMVKKDNQQVRFSVKKITTKFESYFWDYLKSLETTELTVGDPELSKPMEMLIRDIIYV